MAVPERVRLDATLVRSLLEQLAARLDEAGIEAEILVVGGAAIALSVRPERDNTVDIDVFARLTDEIQAVVDDIAEEETLPPSWLNAKAQQFMSPVFDHSLAPVLVQSGTATIRLMGSRALLAMKLRAGRVGKDLDDIEALVRVIGISSVDEAHGVLDEYYGGEEQMRPTAAAFLASLFGDR